MGRLRSVHLSSVLRLSFILMDSFRILQASDMPTAGGTLNPHPVGPEIIVHGEDPITAE